VQRTWKPRPTTTTVYMVSDSSAERQPSEPRSLVGERQSASGVVLVGSVMSSGKPREVVVTGELSLHGVKSQRR
jgi:hypothetical protein